MGFESGLGFGLRHELRPQLRLEQKQALKHLLELRLTLRHEGFFKDAVQGIEGMRVADGILTDQGLRGLLIGGLAEAVWNPRHTQKDFDTHKDVDVLVAESPDVGKINRLQGGVDWWLPQEEYMKIYHRGVDSTEEGVRCFWENAYGVRLAFGVHNDYFNDFAPGLYLPDPSFVIGMRKAEVFAKISTEKVSIDYDVEEAFTEKLEKSIKYDRAPVVKKVKSWDEDTLVTVNALDDFGHETYVAINSVGR